MPKKPENQSNNQDWTYIKRLLAYLKGEEKYLVYTAICLIGYGFAQAYAPALIAKIVDEHITQKDLNGLKETITWLLAVYILLLVTFRFQLILLGSLGQRVLLKLRLSIFEKMQRLSLGFYYDNEPGDLMSRLINDTSNVGQLFSQSIAQTFGSVVSLIAVIIGMFILDWRLALSTFAVIPIMVYLTFYFSKRSRKAFQKSTKALGDLSANVEEDLRMIRESQSFAREQVAISEFDQINANNRDANIEAIRITAAFSPSIDVLSTLALVIVISFGGYLAYHGLTTVGIVVAFLTYAQRFYRPIQMLSTFYTQLQSTLASAERIYHIIDSEPEKQNPEIESAIDNVKGAVAFDHVYFGYDENKMVLKNISFNVKPGQSTAFIGETGVGKSTTINLIPRYYQVQEGQVLIDDINVNNITLNTLRSQIAEVPQSSFLFTDTIANNISFGQAQPDIERIINAAKSAQAHEFITSLEQGYDTVIGGQGAHLSAGQRQLICIARALYADPQILLLDEATSNIDSQTEERLQHAVNEVLKGRTSFVIAHRLSTIRNVDQIIVLGQEGVLQQGSHDELMQEEGYYQQAIQSLYGDKA